MTRTIEMTVPENGMLELPDLAGRALVAKADFAATNDAAFSKVNGIVVLGPAEW